ncbi:inversin [Rhipicephalus sanguineus]|uniref:inversin n=1 Tax=Rhipicephalus sanguineus TaxID=34632 RepID=UPI0020C25205|nr:inversin [Rhipicephalus sanguineus]
METPGEDRSELHLCALRGIWSDIQPGLLEPGKLEVRDRLGRTPLFLCVMLGDSQGAQMLLRAGARPDHGDHAGQTPLHLAARKGHRSLVRLLLSAGAPWTRGDVHGCTPLHCVATVSLPQARSVLAMLLECMDASQVDLQDKLKQTALHKSALACHSENMLALLRKGANPLMQDIDGRTALHLCAASSQPAALGCTSLLLDAEPFLTSWQDYHGCTPLHLAVASGSVAVIDLLTQRSSSEVNALDDLFRTPLHWAAILGRLEVCRLLLERCADASLTDRAGATPLRYACTSDEAGTLVPLLLSHHHAVENVDLALKGAALAGNVAAVRALHCYETHPEAAGKWISYLFRVPIFGGLSLTAGLTVRNAAVLAAAARGHLEVLQWMLDVCGDPQQPPSQLTPLMVAACGGHGGCVLALLDVGASAHAVDAGGRIALHWAAVGEQASICRLLIQRGCRVDASDNQGRTALHYASSRGSAECASVLLQAHANPNLTDAQGRTALHWAARCGSVAVAELLCASGALLSVPDLTRHRRTALDEASMHEELCGWLRSRGAVGAREIRHGAAFVIQVLQLLIFSALRVPANDSASMDASDSNEYPADPDDGSWFTATRRRKPKTTTNSAPAPEPAKNQVTPRPPPPTCG